jgi:hypothetical protein
MFNIIFNTYFGEKKSEFFDIEFFAVEFFNELKKQPLVTSAKLYRENSIIYSF